MSRVTREKLTRYLINADPFLWNVLNGKNKKKRVIELKLMGFLSDYSDRTNTNYSRINQDLLIELGIEGIIERIVVPKVTTLFSSYVIDYFRRCWEQGQTPTIDYLREKGLYQRRIRSREVWESHWHVDEPPAGYKDPSFVFFQIEKVYNYVERWTVFAGLWFEEIEPLLESSKQIVNHKE